MIDLGMDALSFIPQLRFITGISKLHKLHKLHKKRQNKCLFRRQKALFKK